MTLWNQVCVTDPDVTKRMTHGAKLVAIDAQSQVKRATEVWGPYGLMWGLKDLKFGLIVTPDGKSYHQMSLDAVFFYTMNDGTVAQFEISTDIEYNPRKELRKCLMTDATTKALSKLGFNSDVFEGKFDDNKYVADLKADKKVANFQQEKDAKTTNFMNAVTNTGANEEAIIRTLGAEGYELLTEVTTTEARVAFIAALKKSI